MLRGEFEYLIGKEVTDEEYKLIEKVYMYHPAIKASGGKEQIAEIYKVGGMSVIRNMEETADLMIGLNRELEVARANVNKVINRIQNFKEGNFEYEQCRQAIQEAIFITHNNEERNFMKELIKKRFGNELIKEVLKDIDK